MELVELPGLGGDVELEERTRLQSVGTWQGRVRYLKGPQQDYRLTMQEWCSSIGVRRSADENI